MYTLALGEMRHFFLLFLFFASLQAHLFGYLYIGPEVYYFKRLRAGGTRQTGEIDGVRLGFDRIKGSKWYLGADYLYACGKIKGETSSGMPLESRLRDQIFEMRLGFAFQQPGPRCPFITPFVGWGSFCEINHFIPPSPMPFKFTDTFNYVVVGFLSGVNFTALLSMGINFKVKFMSNGKSKVTDDPSFDDVTLTMGDETLYRLDLPITYKPCHSLFGMDFQLNPFYEFRHFGGREGHPFDFIDTKFHIYGARLAFMY